MTATKSCGTFCRLSSAIAYAVLPSFFLMDGFASTFQQALFKQHVDQRLRGPARREGGELSAATTFTRIFALQDGDVRPSGP